MSLRRIAFTVVVVSTVALGLSVTAFGEQVWTKCHITCRCSQDNQVGNFMFVLPVDTSPDIGLDADLACKSLGHGVCVEGCNSYKFSYTYQVTSP